MAATYIIHLLDKAGRKAECNTRGAVFGFTFREYHGLMGEADGDVRTCARRHAAYLRRLAVARAARAATA